MTIRLLAGDCRDVLPTLPAGSVQCCVTSPPYFGLRDYGHAAQLGLEATPDAYVAALVDVFRAVREVLADDGTLWLNIGDSYGSGNSGQMVSAHSGGVYNKLAKFQAATQAPHAREPIAGMHKQLLGIPWRVAFALQADGWTLRQDIIWAKPNPMPESVTDRCTKAHEYVFLLAKSARYYFDAAAISEAATMTPQRRFSAVGYGRETPGRNDHNSRLSLRAEPAREYETRNRRSVWTIATQPFAEAHFATMAPELARGCILAGCPPGGVVLDPFAGAGTTGLVADRLQRDALLIELNPDYVALAGDRIRGDAPLFAEVTA